MIPMAEYESLKKTRDDYFRLKKETGGMDSKKASSAEKDPPDLMEMDGHGLDGFLPKIPEYVPTAPVYKSATVVESKQLPPSITAESVLPFISKKKRKTMERLLAKLDGSPIRIDQTGTVYLHEKKIAGNGIQVSSLSSYS